MNRREGQGVIYWDASAIISSLIKDAHSEEAQKWAQEKGVHLISSLAYAEVRAVLFRIKREGVMADVFVEAALETLEKGPWRRLNVGPAWDLMVELSKRWPLRGADLWHLSVAKGLREHLRELKVLTFDTRLRVAVEGEGLGLY